MPKTIRINQKQVSPLIDLNGYIQDSCKQLRAYQERTSKPPLTMQSAFENALIKSKLRQHKSS